MTVNPESYDMDYKERMTYRPQCEECGLDIRVNEEMEEVEGLGELFIDSKEGDTVHGGSCPPHISNQKASCPHCGNACVLDTQVRLDDVKDKEVIFNEGILCDSCLEAFQVKVRVMKSGSQSDSVNITVIDME